MGACCCELGNGDILEDLLKKHSDKIPQEHRLKTFHALSMIFFYEGKWKKVIYWQNKITRNHQDFKSIFPWLPYLMRCISYLELSDPDNASSHLDGLFKVCKELDNDFLNLNYSILEDLLEHKSLDSIPKKRLREYQSRLSILSEMDNHLFYAQYFNISTWLRGIEENRMAVELIKSEGANSLFSVAS